MIKKWKGGGRERSSLNQAHRDGFHGRLPQEGSPHPLDTESGPEFLQLRPEATHIVAMDGYYVFRHAICRNTQLRERVDGLTGWGVHVARVVRTT